MSVRPIITQENPLLRQMSDPIREINEDILQLLTDMAETMYAAEGVGLAAVQIGVPVRAIVFDVGDGLVELINPTMVDFDGEQFGPEGCLSIPGFHSDVRRYHWVKAEGLDRTGKLVTVEGEGLLARCLQHEIDHLNGILFIDYLEKESVAEFIVE